MVIEILYGNYFLFGDESQADYIKACLPGSEFIYTEINDRPYFADNVPDLIYMGAMSESNQRRAIKALMPYKKRLTQLISNDVHMLFTANSCDILGNYITDDGEKTECLGLFDFHVVRKMMNRFNAMTLGNYNGIDIVGYKSQFGLAYPDSCDEKFFDTERGVGLNPECSWEGFHRNNLIATYLIGPFLILNPKFTKQFLGEITKTEVKIPFETVALECYERRLSEFKDPARKIV